jgi:tetratricopeptide (TPR) repeat protein
MRNSERDADQGRPRRHAIAPNAAAPDARTAHVCDGIAHALSACGRYDDALAAGLQTLSICRGLSEAPAGQNDRLLAAALDHHGGYLRDAGRGEALQAMEESLAIRRTLANEGGADTLAEFAAALNNASVHRADARRVDDAVDASAESVALYRRLSLTVGDRFAAEMATALSNHAINLRAVQQLGRALGAVREAVRHYRRLVTSDPKRFTADLASVLNNLSVLLDETGDHEGGSLAASEAVGLFRQVADAPRATVHPQLAAALNNHSHQLAAMGHAWEALVAVEEAVAIYRGLARGHPKAFATRLAATLLNRANRLRAVGRPHDALTTIEEAIRTVSATETTACADVTTAASSDLALWLLDAYLGLCEHLGTRAHPAVVLGLHLSAQAVRDETRCAYVDSPRSVNGA